MKLTTHTTDYGTLLTVNTDRLDSKIAPDLKSKLIALISDNTSGNLCIDLTMVGFADSSGLSALLLAYRLFRDANRKLVLAGVTDRVNKLIAISQLTNVFVVASDTAHAGQLLQE